MNLHILFCPPTEGTVLPTSVIALSLEDEVQYRCAGFVQAEIERYADELEELAPNADDGSEEEESDGEESGNESRPRRKKGKRSRGKKSAEVPTDKSSSSHLEREYAFMNVIATFLRAIKTGAIHYGHSATILAHYGRLGPVFDLCSKVIVDILREEGMYNGQGSTVVEVVLQSLREVSVPVQYTCPTHSDVITVLPALSRWHHRLRRPYHFPSQGARCLSHDSWCTPCCCAPS